MDQPTEEDLVNDPKHDAAWHGTEATQPKPTAADVLAAHQVRTARGDAWLCRCGTTSRMPFEQHQADMLAAAGLLATAPCCPPSPEEVVNGWLVERHTHCTCGGGPPFGHEPGCGLVPLAPLSEVKGMAEHDAQVLRDAADDLHEPHDPETYAAADWLHARAAELVACGRGPCHLPGGHDGPCNPGRDRIAGGAT